MEQFPSRQTDDAVAGIESIDVEPDLVEGGGKPEIVQPQNRCREDERFGGSQ